MKNKDSNAYRQDVYDKYTFFEECSLPGNLVYLGNIIGQSSEAGAMANIAQVFVREERLFNYSVGRNDSIPTEPVRVYFESTAIKLGKKLILETITDMESKGISVQI